MKFQTCQKDRVLFLCYFFSNDLFVRYEILPLRVTKEQQSYRALNAGLLKKKKPLTPYLGLQKN